MADQRNYRIATSAVTAFVAVSILGVGPALSRQKKPTIDNTHCACACATGTELPIVEYSNPGSCSALNGKTCNVEVNQQGTRVVRTGQLINCGSRVIMPLQSIPNLKPLRAPMRQ
jgi:hypothetical protein